MTLSIALTSGGVDTIPRQSTSSSTARMIKDMVAEIGSYEKIFSAILNSESKFFVVASSSTSSELNMIPDKPFLKDPQVGFMSKQQVYDAVMASFGSWVDREDIPDDWVDQMRQEESDRLADLYAPQQS